MSLIIPANSLAGGFAIDNSLRFNSGSSDYLSRTPASATNKKTFTISFWLKTSVDTGDYTLFYATGSGSHETKVAFDTSERLFIYDFDGASFNMLLKTNRVFRDVSAWYHIVYEVDTTNATADDRIKLYVNGIQETSFVSRTNPPLNHDTEWNGTGVHYIGRDASASYINGYLSEVYNIDGQALTPTDFGEFDEDSGVWKPIAYSGSYGTNGFFLEFQDSGALGTDSSGNANTFTVNNLTSIDQTTDTPTNNFATWNPLSNYSSVTMSEGNMKAIVSASSPTPNCSGSIYPTTGKWYWEGKITESGSNHMFGIRPDGLNYNQGNYWNVSGTYSAVTYYADNGYVYTNGASSAYGNTYASGDIIGVAMDLTNGFVYFSKNGTWQNSGVPTSGATGTGAKTIPTLGLPYTFALGSGSSSWSTGCEINTGNAPYTIASGNADANGYGNFEYAVPTGYLSLCTKNLSEVNS